MQKQTLIILVFILLSSALLGSSMLRRGHLWGDDFAAYIDQADSILNSEMETYVQRNEYTVTQSSHEKGHQMGPAAYPWGFPLMLVPVYAWMGISPLALKLPVTLAYLGFLLVFYFLTNRHFSPTLSLLAVSLFAFNPVLISYQDFILSDIPFLFLSSLAILLADMYIHETGEKRSPLLAVITGTAIFTAFFVRTQGLILLGSLLLLQGIRFLGRRENRHQLVIDTLIIVGSFGTLWGINSLIFPGGQTSYLALYEDFTFNTITGNIVSYSLLFKEFFGSLPGNEFVFGIFAILFFIGLIARFKADLLFVLYFALYLFVLWTWPEWQGYRFIFPILPFFIYFSFQGGIVLLENLNKKHKVVGQKIAYVLILLIVVGFVYNAGSNAYINLKDGRKINGPFDPFSMETYNFIKEETSPDSIIVFFKPRAMRLMTDRDSLALTECERMLEGDYLALSKKVGENLQIPPERIHECNLPLERVFNNRRFVVYKILD